MLWCNRSGRYCQQRISNRWARFHARISIHPILMEAWHFLTDANLICTGSTRLTIPITHINVLAFSFNDVCDNHFAIYHPSHLSAHLNPFIAPDLCSSFIILPSNAVAFTSYRCPPPSWICTLRQSCNQRLRSRPLKVFWPNSPLAHLEHRMQSRRPGQMLLLNNCLSRYWAL